MIFYCRAIGGWRDERFVEGEDQLQVALLPHCLDAVDHDEADIMDEEPATAVSVVQERQSRRARDN